MHSILSRAKNITSCLVKSSRINVFIDTSSISHLSDLSFRDKNYFELISESFCLKTSNFIKNEFTTNLENRPKSSRVSGKILERWEITANVDKELIDEVIGNFFIPEYLGQPPKKNKGEIDLTAVAMHQIFFRKKDRIILLIDDRAARNNFVKDINNTFYIGEVWNSIDIVIFMYLTSIGNLTYEVVKDAIRDIISFSSFSTKDFRSPNSQNDQLARQSMLRFYDKRLKRIKKLKNIFSNNN